MCISRKIYADLDTFLRVTWVSSFDLDLHRGQGWKYTSLQISQKEGKKWNYKLHQLIHQIYSRFIGTNLIRLLWKVKVTRSLKNSLERYFFKKIFDRKAGEVIFTSKDNLYRGDRKMCSSGDLDERSRSQVNLKSTNFQAPLTLCNTAILVEQFTADYSLLLLLV